MAFLIGAACGYLIGVLAVWAILTLACMRDERCRQAADDVAERFASSRYRVLLLVGLLWPAVALAMLRGWSVGA